MYTVFIIDHIHHSMNEFKMLIFVCNKLKPSNNIYFLYIIVKCKFSRRFFFSFPFCKTGLKKST